MDIQPDTSETEVGIVATQSKDRTPITRMCCQRYKHKKQAIITTQQPCPALEVDGFPPLAGADWASSYYHRFLAFTHFLISLCVAGYASVMVRRSHVLWASGLTNLFERVSESDRQEE